MKIAMIGSWNADSGASVHAELVGKKWVEKGIDLKIFTFYRHSFHGTAITKKIEEEEDYVTRCFTVYNAPKPEMNIVPILKSDFDIFVAQDLGMIPMQHLLSIFSEVRKKAKTVNVIHDGELSAKPEFFKFIWDQVVCFDERYRDFLKSTYPKGGISIIPYPAVPLNVGDKNAAREKLNLPKEKKIVLIFGQAAEFAVNTTMVLDRLAEKYDIMLILVTELKHVLDKYKNIQDRIKFDLNIIEEFPDSKELYTYLHASDCMIYNKHSKPTVVVGSSVFQCMGSGCPTIALDSNFVYSFNKEVMKYNDFYELEKNLIDVFEEGPKYKKQQKAVRTYLEEKSAGPVADKFLELFEKLLKKDRRAKWF